MYDEDKERHKIWQESQRALYKWEKKNRTLSDYLLMPLGWVCNLSFFIGVLPILLITGIGELFFGTIEFIINLFKRKS